MKRKVYKSARERQRKIRKDALSEMRAARQAIDPKLIEKARFAVVQAFQNIEDYHNQPDRRGEIPVNRKQNMRVITKYLEMNADNPALITRFEKLLSEHKS